MYKAWFGICNKKLLKVHYCKYENLLSPSWQENNNPKFSHYNTFNFWDISTREILNVCLQTHRIDRIC